mgnify:CR=1 FL=1
MSEAYKIYSTNNSFDKILKELCQYAKIRYNAKKIDFFYNYQLSIPVFIRNHIYVALYFVNNNYKIAEDDYCILELKDNSKVVITCYFYEPYSFMGNIKDFNIKYIRKMKLEKINDVSNI